MLERLEAALSREIKTLGHPRAALPGFAVMVLAYNVLAQLTEQAHRAKHPQLEVSACHLALEIGCDCSRPSTGRAQSGTLLVWRAGRCIWPRV